MIYFETTEIMIDKITNPGDLIDDDHTQELARSIEENGLLHPILVRRVVAGGFELIAGVNRLSAIRILGKKSIEARIVSGANDSDALGQKIAENLFRKKISKSERAEMLYQWKEAYEAEHPEVRRGYAGAAAKHNLPEVEEPAEPFVEVVEKVTGQKKRQTHQDLADAKLLRTFSDQALAVLDVRKVPHEARLEIAKQPEGIKLAALNDIASGDPYEWVIQNFDKADVDMVMEARKEIEFPESDVGDEEYLRRCQARPLDSKDFDVDAILYKRGVKAMQEFKKQMKVFMADAKMDKGRGPFYRMLNRLFTMEHPRYWKVCGECSRENAERLEGKKCPVCYGAKYTIAR